jgi:hypothetical protein
MKTARALDRDAPPMLRPPCRPIADEAIDAVAQDDPTTAKDRA